MRPAQSLRASLALLGELLAGSGDPTRFGADFAGYGRAISLHAARGLCVFFISMALPWWLLDRALFSSAEALRLSLSWRLTMTFYLAAIAALLFFAPHQRVERRIYPISTAATMLGAAALGALLGRMGGVEMPSTAAIYLLPLASVVMVGPLRTRILCVSLASASPLAGFFGAHPQHLSHPYAGFLFGIMAFSCLIAIVIGHTITSLVRQSFAQAQLLAERASSLQERVQERTQTIRELAAHIEDERVAERARLARELHDTLGQTLTLLRLRLDASAPQPPRPDARLPGAAEIIDGALVALRALVSELRPPPLDADGFALAVSELAARLERDASVSCVWSLDGDLTRLGAPQRLGLYRAIQEATTNTARHARAQQVAIALHIEDAGAKLCVTDDGVGFAPEAVPAGHFGLIGLTERATLLGGSLRTDSAPGRGTRVELSLPLHPEPRADALLPGAEE